MDAILIVKNNRLFLELENGKELPLNIGNNIDEDWDGMDIYEDEYQLSSGQVSWILIEGKKYYPKPPQNQQQPNPQNRNHSNFNQTLQEIREVGFSPYNFVPLNKKVVSSDNTDNDFSKYALNSGYIELTIETQTPTFIRGNGEKSSRTLEINGKPIISGSSLRGMIRTMVEICSWSRMEFVNDQRLYFRGIAEATSNIKRNNLKTEYASYLGEYAKNVKGGYLSFNEEDRTYYITPALKDGEVFKINYKGSYAQANIQLTASGAEFHSVFNNKKHDRRISLIDANATQIFLSQEDINNYKNDYDKTDSSRSEKNKQKVPNIIDLLKQDKYKNAVPVLYVQYFDAKDNPRYVFGHTLNMRVPYKSTIKEHLPEDHQNTTMDFANSIFGSTESATKVFFEDAIWQNGKENPMLLPISKHKMLSSPKPTAFQMYLDQGTNWDKHTNKMMFKRGETLENWNSQANTRGYKMYWHKNTENGTSSTWMRSEAYASEKQEQAPIECINKAQSFVGRVRFDNLSNAELGALLFAIQLPEDNHCHKIGIGKPLGLGSIKINANLFLTNRKNRYTELLTSEGAWNEAQTKGDIATYKAAFEEYILPQIGEKQTSLWKVDRLKELKAMLEFNQNHDQSWFEKTRYMELPEFRNRRVLPNPTEIKPQ